MNIFIKENRAEVITQSVEIIKEQITTHDQDKPFVLGLSTGLTVLDICKELAELYKQNQVSFRNLIVFIAGEFVGYSKQRKTQYLLLLYQHFFSVVDIEEKNIHILDGRSKDLDDECERFEQTIAACGGMDLFVGSLGENANLAFNGPGSSLQSRTRLKTLTIENVKADVRFFGKENSVPTQALTMGLGTIFDSKNVLVVIYGVQKAFVTKCFIQEGISDVNPASILQRHPRTTILVDKVAARFLSPL